MLGLCLAQPCRLSFSNDIWFPDCILELLQEFAKAGQHFISSYELVPPLLRTGAAMLHHTGGETMTRAARPVATHSNVTVLPLARLLR